MFTDTSRVSPRGREGEGEGGRERESRARHILSTSQMLSPSREVLLFRGARLDGRETTGEEKSDGRHTESRL